MCHHPLSPLASCQILVEMLGESYAYITLFSCYLMRVVDTRVQLKYRMLLALLIDINVLQFSNWPVFTYVCLLMKMLHYIHLDFIMCVHEFIVNGLTSEGYTDTHLVLFLLLFCAMENFKIDLGKFEVSLK